LKALGITSEQPRKGHSFCPSVPRAEAHTLFQPFPYQNPGIIDFPFHGADFLVPMDLGLSTALLLGCLVPKVAVDCQVGLIDGRLTMANDTAAMRV
jgi:hypothetical protein